MSNKTIPERSYDTTIIINRLLEAKTGDEITYKELSDLISRDVQADGRGVLVSATRILRHEQRMNFKVIRNIGIKLLCEIETINASGGYIRKIHNASKNAGRELNCVKNIDNLSGDEKINFFTKASLFNTLKVVTTQPKIKKLEAKIAISEKRLPLSRTLEAFQEA